jgi:hypothetical protein
MGEEKTIRGRRVIYERNGPPRGPAEDLRYTFDVIDERGNQLEELGRVADLAIALTAFEAHAPSIARSAGDRDWCAPGVRPISWHVVEGLADGRDEESAARNASGVGSTQRRLVGHTSRRPLVCDRI